MEAVRFGVKEENHVVKVVGYADAQMCTITYYNPSYLSNRTGPSASGWMFSSSGHYVHAGPTNSNSVISSWGCICLCGSNQMSLLNQTLLQYSGAQSETQLASSGCLKIVFESAARPPLVRKTN